MFLVNIKVLCDISFAENIVKISIVKHLTYGLAGSVKCLSANNSFRASIDSSFAIYAL